MVSIHNTKIATTLDAVPRTTLTGLSIYSTPFWTVVAFAYTWGYAKRRNVMTRSCHFEMTFKAESDVKAIRILSKETMIGSNKRKSQKRCRNCEMEEVTACFSPFQDLLKNLFF